MATPTEADIAGDIEGEEEVEYVEEVVYEEAEETDEGDAGEDAEGEGASEATDAVHAEKSNSGGPSIKSVNSSPMKTEDEPEPATPPASTAAKEVPEEAAQQPELAKPAEAAAAAGATASGVGGSVGVDLDLKQLEAQAARVAKDVTQVAKDMSSKLTAGLRSAFGASGSAGGAPEAAPAASSAAVSGAAASLSKLAGGLTSWWGSLDPQPAPARDETAERIQSSNKAGGELQALFGLSAEENLVEQFKAKLLQTYACNHNTHTPAIQMAFQGTLYVTDRHTCFSVEERGRKLPFKVPHTQVTRATRQRPPRKGDLSDLLKLELSNGTYLCFKDFDSGSALDSALALVEHLAEQHAGQGGQ